jgi:hypothetical protein
MSHNGRSKDERDKDQSRSLGHSDRPRGPCDPFAGSVKNPDMMQQIIKESLDSFVGQNPQPPGQPPEELAEAFLHHIDERRKATP